MKRCSQGKSCGATCIERSDRCVLELGPVISKSLNEARSKIGVVKLYEQVRKQKIKGFQAKFNRVRADLKGEIGGRIQHTKDILELRKRLQKEGLLPKSKGEDDLKSVFKLNFAPASKKKEGPQILDLGNLKLPSDSGRAPSVPSDLKKMLGDLGGAPKEPTQKPVDEGKWKNSPTMNLNIQLKYLRQWKPEEKEEIESIERELVRRGKTVPGAKASSKKNKSEEQPFVLPSEGQDWRAALGLKLPSGLSTLATGNTKWARVEAEDFDNDFKIYKRIRGDKDMLDWADTINGSRKIGDGSFGTVLLKGNMAVKRGEIGANEPDIIGKVGKADMGPRLLIAELAKKDRSDYGVDIHPGRIAMSVVPGKPIGEAQADTKIAGKNAADIYWKAMADLHRLGIAHNDAHVENILVDDKGKGRWVDMGLAQASPKAALAEAMGIFPTIKGAPANRVRGAAGQGNWQSRRWVGTGTAHAEQVKARGGKAWEEYQQRFPVASKVWENRADAQFKLKKMGLTNEDISTIIDHGIRSPMETYNQGPWAKLTDKQAQEVLNTLYDGI